jgi:hypothetical protein
LVVVFSSGCAEIEVVDRSAAALNSALDSGRDIVEAHDVAVLAVDFDPPLNYQEIMDRRSRGEGITLLVAVENTGVNTEQNIVVQARLSERSSKTVYVEKRGTIKTIAPGEIKIVHLKDTDIPFSFEYTLLVSIVPVAGETRIDDNSKTYDLLITQS